MFCASKIYCFLKKSILLLFFINITMANVFFDEFFKKRYIKRFVAYSKYFNIFVNKNFDI